MIFMFAVTLTSLGMLVYENYLLNNFTLSIISVLLFTLAVLLGIKAYSVLVNGKKLVGESIN